MERPKEILKQWGLENFREGDTLTERQKNKLKTTYLGICYSLGDIAYNDYKNKDFGRDLNGQAYMIKAILKEDLYK